MQQTRGANVDLTIAANLVTGGQIGILFRAAAFIDVFPTPSRAVVVADNTIRGMLFSGINANPGTAEHPGELHHSLVADNVSSDNGRDGIVLFGANTGNHIRDNLTERNGRNGIYAARVVLAGQPFAPAGNTFQGNRMVDNAAFDARDDARELNTWTANLCVTDLPAGTICGVGSSAWNGRIIRLQRRPVDSPANPAAVMAQSRARSVWEGRLRSVGRKRPLLHGLRASRAS